jgi:hypothetical protein
VVGTSILLKQRVGSLQAESTLSAQGLSHSGHHFTDNEGGCDDDLDDLDDDDDDDDDDEDEEDDSKDGIYDDNDDDYDWERDEDNMITKVGSSSDYDKRYEMYG